MKVKSEDAYFMILKWLHNDYAPPQIALTIRLIRKENIAKAINALLEIGSILFEAVSDKDGNVIPERYEKLSAFILYHWEGTFTLRRSIINALCNFYNSSFVLLRCSLDTLLDGLFYQCLCQRRFRESKVLDEIDHCDLKRLVDALKELLKEEPSESKHLEKNSAHIFDLLDEFPKYKPKPSAMYRLLSKWGLFAPIERPERLIAGIYGKLSFSVHQHYSSLDIGRAIIEGKEIFEYPSPFLEKSIKEYLELYNQISKLWITSEINLLEFTSER